MINYCYDNTASCPKYLGAPQVFITYQNQFLPADVGKMVYRAAGRSMFITIEDETENNVIYTNSFIYRHGFNPFILNPGRLYRVQPENRRFSVGGEERTLRVKRGNRTFTVEANNE